ncbi:hypothetical protein BpHYR1_042706 [Brachionus plicatilis]|uniref:Uncharacterized protein n=1 Tax=Brachionus plicatilis TaxID=10195 RepID=A0A3M7R098_BRAPC|nr:hypothetical protein BpHYR1_042706 [Brachionus plicatilis]
MFLLKVQEALNLKSSFVKSQMSSFSGQQVMFVIYSIDICISLEMMDLLEQNSILILEVLRGVLINNIVTYSI